MAKTIIIHSKVVQRRNVVSVYHYKAIRPSFSHFLMGTNIYIFQSSLINKCLFWCNLFPLSPSTILNETIKYNESCFPIHLTTNLFLRMSICHYTYLGIKRHILMTPNFQRFPGIFLMESKCPHCPSWPSYQIQCNHTWTFLISSFLNPKK